MNFAKQAASGIYVKKLKMILQSVVLDEYLHRARCNSPYFNVGVGGEWRKRKED